MDDKGRVAVPAKHRDVLRASYGPQLIVTRGLVGKCLWIYPLEEWRLFKTRLSASGLGGSKLVRLQRLMFASAEACEMDRSGRIMLPDSLVSKAELEKEIMFVGMDSHIEVWRPDLWQAEEVELGDSQEALLDLLDDVVF